MLLFLDTEFTGLDQPNPSLISLALVKEDGDFFYAELPPSFYTHRASDWVQENVLPHLWGGSYRMRPEELSRKVCAWIEAIPGQTVIVTDAPDYDFEQMLKPLLSPWPQNLAKTPMLFDRLILGGRYQEKLATFRDAYFTPDKPEHHALHDAQALRRAWLWGKEFEGLEDLLCMGMRNN
ncbi:protein of unknown function [Formivibrio citricus]|uniref:Uncharacterized protein n=1 Tax=Formivibrio citricus TaxID=83765 RepID=A0A1I5CU56_9NEIS|nr:3'-5' exoribonuclease [Formivibrio citricus]SFN90457.1 protein of unknown function [Formivibrio citricus]